MYLSLCLKTEESSFLLFHFADTFPSNWTKEGHHENYVRELSKRTIIALDFSMLDTAYLAPRTGGRNDQNVQYMITVQCSTSKWSPAHIEYALKMRPVSHEWHFVK